MTTLNLMTIGFTILLSAVLVHLSGMYLLYTKLTTLISDRAERLEFATNSVAPIAYAMLFLGLLFIIVALPGSAALIIVASIVPATLQIMAVRSRRRLQNSGGRT